MISIAGIRFFIEFSSILVLAFLCIMHEFTDVTWAKQFSNEFDHASSQGLEELDQTQASFETFASPPSSKTTSNDDDESDHHDQKPFVRFYPESLDFGHHSIGMPAIETVYVVNDHAEISIQLISISGNTEHFHCSFFEDKILSPLSNTSFQVVFLARQEGLVNNTLYIHSSAGLYHYGVSAYGDVSPFRVRPLIGARVPLNSSFASLIYIYNPFSTPLQLTEMYTSGGGLHLELPDDEFEAKKEKWQVPPYETRPVMRAHFVARIASNHTSYIRIRTSQPEVQLMLPVEVEVSNSPGLYSPLDTLDFGVLRARHDPPKTLPIQVINAAQKSVSVQSIVVTPISDGLAVQDFTGPIKLPPQSSNPYHVAKLVLDPGQFSCSGLCLGKVLIKSKNNQYKLTIPFIVRVIPGELHFNSSQSHFFMNQSSNYTAEQRVLNMENRFDLPITVHDIILPDEAKPYFRLSTKHPYSLPITLPVGESFPLLKVEFTPSPQLSHFSTVFRLLTNLSYFDFPLYAYQGRLELFIPNSSDQSKLDMGLVGVNEQKTATFLVANHNPIAIRLIYWHSNITGVMVELVGTSQGDISAISQRIDPSSTPTASRNSEPRLLEPNHVAVFRVHVQRLSNEGLHSGIVSIVTTYEKMSVPLMIKVLSGSLSAEPVIMPKTFPGKVVRSMLNIRSNYSSNIKIKGAFIEPKDDRFKIKLIDQLIKPGHDNQVQITFDPSAACFQKLCYSALDVEKEVGHLWLLGSGLYSDTAYVDKELYKLLRNQWLIMSETDRNPAVNVRLQIDGFGSFVTSVQAHQHWPRLANKLVIRFPSIRVGQKVTKELMIENTADRQVLVQAINVIDYPNSEILLQLTANTIFHQQWSKSDLQAIQSAIRNGHNRSAFSLHNNTIASNSQVQRITEWLGVEPNSNSYIMLLPPGVRHRLAVTFNPPDEKNYTSLLILRNNLTIIDVVMLRGEGGRGLLKIGKTLPNTSNSRLVLNFPERTLERRCRNLVMAKTSASAASNTAGGAKSANYKALLMRERFKATNIGRMALQIRNFLIDGMPCEGHGFRVNRCEPILLSPNQTFDFEVLYSPDFTQHLITHELTIMIDDDILSAQRFSLVANIPANLLTLCLEALPRPAWEPHLYYILVMMALFVLLLSTVVAIFDGHRISLNYFNSRYDFTKLNDKNNDPDLNDGGGDGKDASTSESNELIAPKKMANGSSITLNGSATMNGKAHSYSNSMNMAQKVRNRRGANKNNSNNNPGTIMLTVNQVGSRKPQVKASNSTTELKDESGKNSISKQNGTANFDHQEQQFCTSDWNHVTQSDYIVRQDSSSSERSNRSTESSLSSSKSVKDDQKKSSNDSLNESASNDNSGNNSPDMKRNTTTASKNPKQSTKQSKSADSVTTRNPLKKQSNVTSMKTAKKCEKKSMEKSKPNLSNSVSILELLKSSTESLASSAGSKFEIVDNNEIMNGGDGGAESFVPKTRSATLPTMTNVSTSNTSSKQSTKRATNSPSNMFASETDFCVPDTAANHQINQGQRDDLLVMKNSLKENQKINQKTTDIFQNAGIFKSDSMFTQKSTDYTEISEPNHHHHKDIWDTPITNFDMDQIVKQTEEFEKIAPIRQSANRRNERNNQQAKTTTCNDDKWEIGEWSNDLLLNRNNSQPNNANHDSGGESKYFNAPPSSFDTIIANVNTKNHRISPSTTINYQEYRNRTYLNDTNKNSRILKQCTSLNNHHVKQQQNVLPSPSPPIPASAPPPPPTPPATNSNNSSLSSLNPSTTFSPVIGRPQPIQKKAEPERNHMFNRFDDNFSLLDKPLNCSNTAMPLELPLPFSPKPSVSNFSGNLESFLESVAAPAPVTKPIGAFGGSKQSKQLSSPPGLPPVSNNSGNPFGSFLQSSGPWNPAPGTLSDFSNSLDTCLSPGGVANNQRQSLNDMFNLDSDPMWSPRTTTSWSITEPKASNIFTNFPTSESNSKFCTSLTDNCNIVSPSNMNNNWPISSPGIDSGSSNVGGVRGHNDYNSNTATSCPWSPFNSSFDYNFGQSTNEPFNLPVSSSNATDGNGREPPSRSSSSEASVAFQSPSTVFESFGRSWPWSSPPKDRNSSLGTSALINGGASNNFLSPSPTPGADSLFSHNSSPSSSSGGSSASGNSDQK